MSAVLLLPVLALAGCRGLGSDSRPTVAITQVPPADAGGPQKIDFIAGRVTGAGQDDRVVLYARSSMWWIQPFSNQPFTTIQPDSTWKSATHLGTEYAAMLVAPNYLPNPKVASLPPVGDGVLAVTTAAGAPGEQPAITKVLRFSGYDWAVRAADSSRGGEPNSYSPDNAWVDKQGYLHLRMTLLNGKWTCAEVNLARSLGYGTYSFVVQDTAHFNPFAVLGLFTWDDMRSDGFRNEMDFQLSRWGIPDGKNAQYVMQPFYVPQNVSRFTVPAGAVMYTLRWAPGSASFSAVHGAETISQHTFTASVPTPDSETIHIGLYDYHHNLRSGTAKPTEVVIEKFQYLP